MVYFAVVSLRTTKRGYRYPLSYIIASSIVLSFAGGATLQFFGLGYVIDQELGDMMFTYPSQERIDQGLWQAPQEGRLIGTALGPTGTATAAVWFRDVDGNAWQVVLTDLHTVDRTTLGSQQRVRVLGQWQTPEGRAFYACGVFPWMYGTNRPPMAKRSEQRQAFLQRMYEHSHTPTERLDQLERAIYSSSSQPQSGPCAEMAVVHRVERSLRGDE